MSSSLISSPVLTVWEHKSLNCGVCLLFAGPDCSEVIGRENCGRICKQGSCVQASPVSFKCLCRSGGGRQHAWAGLLVCPRKALLLSPDRNMKPPQLCMHSRVICLAGATIFGKGQSRELQEPYIFLNIIVSLWVLYPIPLDVVFVIVTHREATPDRIPHVTAGSL